MAVYSVRGFTVATVATANHVIAALWNPSSTRRIKVLEVGLYRAGTAAGVRTRLIGLETRGTPGSTVTPDADNAWHDAEAPPSGALLDLAAYSVQPGLADSYRVGHNGTGTGSGGGGFVWLFPRGAELIGGAGRHQALAITSGTADIYPACEVYFVWEEN